MQLSLNYYKIFYKLKYQSSSIYYLYLLIFNFFFDSFKNSFKKNNYNYFYKDVSEFI